MTTAAKVLIVGLLAASVVGTLAVKKQAVDTNVAAEPEISTPRHLPRLLDLGANSCVPCKAMKPILAELKEDYSGKLTVEFVDVWKDPSAGKAHKIQSIPTQIFFDADGKEIYRHVGFYGKEEMLAKMKDLGFNL